MTRFPHAGGTRGKKRPAVIVQANVFNAKFKHFIVAEITTNLAAASTPASFLIDVSTPEGKATDWTTILLFAAFSCQRWPRLRLPK